MTSVDWIGFSLASVAVVLTPGPGSLFVTKTAATGGIRAGLWAQFGLMVGDTCLILLSLCGVSALFIAHPALFHGVRIAGAGYLVFLGLQMLLVRSRGPAASVPPPGAPFRRALFITLLNPKAVFFFMAFFPVFVRSTEKGLLPAYAVMACVFMGISGTYLTVLVRASTGLAKAFGSHRNLQLGARALCGCVFLAFGLKVALGVAGVP